MEAINDDIDTAEAEADAVGGSGAGSARAGLLAWESVVDLLPEPGSGLLDRYQPGGAFDEAFKAEGSVRSTYSRIVERFRELDAGDVRRLEKLVADEFRRQGITFTVYSEEEGTERIWPMDLFPRLIAAARKAGRRTPLLSGRRPGLVARRGHRATGPGLAPSAGPAAAVRPRAG